jgi:DNA-binding FadR family transcriptional regulator
VTASVDFRNVARGRFPYLVLTAPQQVAAAIKREIFEGALRPGDKLPAEPVLAELFGVSRPTVRTGLQILCNDGILEVRRGRTGGYRVSNLSFSRLEATVTDFISLSLVVETLTPAQFLEVRIAHELLCAEMAARHRTPEMVERLEEIDAMIDEATLERTDAFDLDLQFHRVLAEASGNVLILTFERAMIAVLHGLLGDGDSVSSGDSLGNIHKIIDAVAAGDPERAREAMRGHLVHSLIHHGLVTDGLPSQLCEPHTADSTMARGRE